MSFDKKNKEESDYRSRVVIHFPPSLVEEPIICNLVKEYDLEFNILRADVGRDRKGLLVLELIGKEEGFKQGMIFLKEKGISVQPLSQDVTRLDERCTHCGACIAICPSGALYIEDDSRRVRFDKDKCLACELCLKGCPTRAMEVYF